MSPFDLTVTALNERSAISPAHTVLERIYAYLPTAVTWNRLEGRPRTNDLTRPMRAEVRDPLWFLARQWQMGEFEAQDAGTPIHARMSTQVTEPESITFANKQSKTLDLGLPLEMTVERQAVAPDLMTALHLGRRWVNMLLDALGGAPTVPESFIAVYRFGAPDLAVQTAEALRDRREEAGAGPMPVAVDLDSLYLATYPRELTLRRAIAGRSVDGALLLADINEAFRTGALASSQFAARGVDLDGQDALIDAAASELRNYWSATFSEPESTEEAWVPPHLEHDFSLHVPEGDKATTLVAKQYPGGRLDWYSFDSAAAQPLAGDGAIDEPQVKVFVPTPIRFRGVPNVRWWEFESQEVGFGITSAAKTDLIKMLLAEFGLVFSNDWFIVPFTAKIGSLIDNRGIVVTDNFGFRTYVEPTARRQSDLRLTGTWGMWTLSRAGVPGEVDARLFLAPAVAKSLETRPLDELLFLRDEMANLVWGVETVIPDPLGGGRDSRVAAKMFREAYAAAEPPPPFEDLGPDVLLRYSLMGTVPENWIPFVSVTLEGGTTTMFLQGAMPRVPPFEPSLAGDGSPILRHNVVLPRGTLLARDPVTNPNLVFEEEVLREGAIIERTIQRTRSADGRTWMWSGRKKAVGRGEGSSGLAFDQALTGKPEA